MSGNRGAAAGQLSCRSMVKSMLRAMMPSVPMHACIVCCRGWCSFVGDNGGCCVAAVRVVTPRGRVCHPSCHLATPPIDTPHPAPEPLAPSTILVPGLAAPVRYNGCWPLVQQSRSSKRVRGCVYAGLHGPHYPPGPAPRARPVCGGWCNLAIHHACCHAVCIKPA